MTAWDLVRRSLWHHRRFHLGVVLGAACATAVIVGALVVGDTIRSSLADQQRLRLGRAEAALVTGERTFRSALAEALGGPLAAEAAPVLHLPGFASTDGGRRAGIVDLLGADRRFFALGPAGAGIEPPPPGRAFVNEPLARHLGIGAGAEILLRFSKPGPFSRDQLMATVEDVSFAVRLKVEAVLDAGRFGHFGLAASQIPPFNVFVSLSWLQEQLALAGRANLLLLGGVSDPGLVRRANAALKAIWTLDDAGLRVRTLATPDVAEVVSDRIFIDDAVKEALASFLPDAIGVLTAFVNEIAQGGRATPYSMVSAVGPPGPQVKPEGPAAAVLALLPPDLGDDEIVLNEWLARDLGAKVGDEVTLRYFTLGDDLRLGTATRALRVASVVPLSGAARDPELMPAFPGLADIRNCREWEPGIPIDLQRIREADEEYWRDHRGTPKAFVSLATGRKLWGNRFGSLTAVRFESSLAPAVKDGLSRRIDPMRLGLWFRDLSAGSEAASDPATDFAGLFLGLGGFLVLAAVLLAALLFVFNMDRRAPEIGLLLAVGLRPAEVRRIVLGEVLLLSLAGGLLGAALGVGYTRLVILGLSTIWRGAVGATTIGIHVRPLTLVVGSLAGTVVVTLALMFALGRAFRRPAWKLLRARGGAAAGFRAPGRASLVIGVACPVLALSLVLAPAGGAGAATAAFFGAGVLLLAGGLAWCRRWLARLSAASRSVLDGVAALGRRNAGRRPGRSLATVLLLACGMFLVVAVQAFRQGPPEDPAARASGTGGFAWFGRTTLPVARDLGTDAGRAAFGLDREELADVTIVPIRVRGGDDASCLNLARPRNPVLLGVDPRELAGRSSFTFAEVPESAPEGSPWLGLDADLGPDIVPAIGDQASVRWSLHAAVGEDLPFRDERGRGFRVRIVATLAASILQGSLLISNADFVERFPSESGYRVFLVDAPPARAAFVAVTLTRALGDVGLELTSTTGRLAAFQEVQNTYLVIFQALGALGLLLGSAGLGLLLLRHAFERRSELALARAVGFRISDIRRLVFAEHGLLLALGLVAGVLSALVAVAPALRGSGAEFPVLPILALVLGVGTSGALGVHLAGILATRGPLLDALRDE